MTTTLPNDLIFAPDGHLTELGLTCVADGEVALLPAAALAHLDACEACGLRLGEAALLSAAAADALRLDPARALVTIRPHVVAEAAPAPRFTPAPMSPRRSRRPPALAIAVALAVAALTAWPALAETAHALPAWIGGAMGWAPTLARLARGWLFGDASTAALAVKGASALLFVVLGIQVARAMSRVSAEAMQGGVR
jgi:hypothetical protein